MAASCLVRLPCLLDPDDLWVVAVSAFRIRLGCRRRGKLRSFFSEAIAPNTFLREVPFTLAREQLCRVSWQMRIYLVRIPHRKGHSIQSVVLPALTVSGRDCCIHGLIRVGPNGRDLKLPQGNSDRTTGPNWFVTSPSC